MIPSMTDSYVKLATSEIIIFVNVICFFLTIADLCSTRNMRVDLSIAVRIQADE